MDINDNQSSIGENIETDEFRQFRLLSDYEKFQRFSEIKEKLQLLEKNRELEQFSQN